MRRAGRVDMCSRTAPRRMVTIPRKTRPETMTRPESVRPRIGDGAGEKHAAKSRAAQLLRRRAAVAVGPARIGIGKSVRCGCGDRGSALAKSRGAQRRWRRDRGPAGKTPGGFEEPNDLRADRGERETAAAAS